MPISKKIMDEIDSNYDIKFQNLMTSILEAEDNHHHYKKEFDEIVSDYLEEEENND